jgi:DNA-binding SARP family transcriptional activator
MDIPSSSLHIFLLGRFEVTCGERRLQVSAWTRRKAAALLQRLALERRLLKEQAIEFLWPQVDPNSGANNLYRTLHTLRQTLDMVLGPGTAEATLVFQDGVFTLRDAVWVDVTSFHSLVQAGDPASLTAALHLYAGDLLPDDRYAEWTLVPRDTLRRQQREARLTLATYACDARDYSRAISLLTSLLAQDPADELVSRELMHIYALAGRRHEALRQYQVCMDALATELGVPPDPQTTALYTSIINGDIAPPPTPVLPAWRPPEQFIPEVEGETPLAGRQSELETLQAGLRSAWHRRGQVLLLAGDSGVGKTHLAFELLRAAAASGIITLYSAAYEQEGQLPYQPFIEAFDRYLVEHQHPLDQNPITHYKHLGSSDPQQEHWALFKATTNLLTSLATRGPVVLLVDDLHAADETSLQLFHYLARQTRAAPVILVATYRTDLATAAMTPFRTLLNTLYREHLSETLHLAPLPEHAVASITAHLLGSEPAPPLLKAIAEITEGNPFFVQEITRMLRASGQVEEREGRWHLRPGMELSVPTGLGELLRERVMRLGPPVESALKTAAVIGREFRFEILRPVAGISDPELLDILDAALVGHLLVESTDGYRFRHPLIRRVLYEALSRGRRARLHTHAARAIEAVYAERPEGLMPYVESLAYHYELSDCRDHTLAYLIQAGQKAAGIYAFEVGVSYFERALALMDELDVADPARRWMILESLGWWEIILADTLLAVRHFQQALALPPGKDWQPTSRDRARLHRGAVMALITAGKAEEAEAHLRAALAGINEHEEAAEYAHVLYNVAQFHWHQGEFREAFDAAEKSLAVAERQGEPVAIARAFEMLALACHSLGEWQQGLAFEKQRSLLSGPALDVTEAFDVHL